MIEGGPGKVVDHGPESVDIAPIPKHLKTSTKPKNNFQCFETGRAEMKASRHVAHEVKTGMRGQLWEIGRPRGGMPYVKYPIHSARSTAPGMPSNRSTSCPARLVIMVSYSARDSLLMPLFHSRLRLACASPVSTRRFPGAFGSRRPS